MCFGNSFFLAHHHCMYVIVRLQWAAERLLSAVLSCYVFSVNGLVACQNNVVDLTAVADACSL